MKILRTTFAILAVLVGTALVMPQTHALNMESMTPLESYTILQNGSVEYASGYLKKNGTLDVITSYIVDPLFYDSPEDFALVSGRPLMSALLFDGYKAAGVIPNWVRSKQTYYIGFAEYVIVSTKSGPDPNPLPIILEQPEDERLLAGSTAFFFTDAEPWGYLSFQWYFKNKPIPGATWSWVTVPNVSKANAGFYHVAVSAGGKPVTSRKATLTVVEPVAIKSHPKSKIITAGKNVTLRVAATGTKPFTYQWYRNEQVITNATKSFYTISKAKSDDSGSYDVIVDNGASWKLSNAAVIKVNP